MLRLIPNPPGAIAGGQILFEGQDLLKLGDAQMRAIRGNRIAMIFQEPMSSLNPSLTVGPAGRRADAASTAACRGREASNAAQGAAGEGAASPMPRAGCRPIRTSTPAACASAR